LSRVHQLCYLMLTCLFCFQCGRTSDKSVEKRSEDALADMLRVTWQREGDSAPQLDRKEVTIIAKEVFRHISLPKMAVQRARLSGELAVEDQKGALALECHISLSGLPFPVVNRLAATGSVADKTGLTNLVRDGIEDVAKALKEMLFLVDADGKQLITALKSAEPDVQILAAKLLGQKRPKGAAAALCPLLRDPREAVAEAAAEELIIVGDPAAVPCVIESISKESLRSEVRAIEILGRIGGSEAVAYLEMTAMGHELQEVRMLSETLLKRLKHQTQKE
jgi:hypothetical protein